MQSVLFISLSFIMCQKSMLTEELAFLEAVEASNLVEVIHFIDLGVNTNCQNLYGHTALSISIKKGSPQIAATLIEHGADIHSESPHGVTPLHMATFSGRIEILKLLLSNGAHFNKRDDMGTTPLMYACAYGHMKCVRELLKLKELEIDATDDFGITALRFASGNHFSEIVRLLKEYGAHRTRFFAKRQLKKSVKDIDTYQRAMALGKILFQSKAYDDSILCFKKAYTLSEKKSQIALLALAQVHNQIGEPRSAIKFSKKVIKNNPGERLLSIAFFQLGLGFYSQGTQKGPTNKYIALAEAEIVKSLEIDPENAEAYFLMAQIYHQTGRSNDAVKYLITSIKKSSDGPYAKLAINQLAKMRVTDEELRQRTGLNIYFWDQYDVLTDNMPSPEIVHRVETNLPGGSIDVEIIITPEGGVSGIRVLKEKPPMDLPANQRKLFEILRQWRFKPVLINGKAVAIRFAFTVFSAEK